MTESGERQIGEVEALKRALREAILDTSRTVRLNYDYDPAGSSWTVDWNDRTKAWAKLCDLDLDEHLPPGC